MLLNSQNMKLLLITIKNNNNINKLIHMLLQINKLKANIAEDIEIESMLVMMMKMKVLSEDLITKNILDIKID